MLYVLNDVPMFPAIYSQWRSGDIIEICYEVKIVLQILVYNHLALILQGNYQKASIGFFLVFFWNVFLTLQRLNFMSSWEENCSSNASDVIKKA